MEVVVTVGGHILFVCATIVNANTICVFLIEIGSGIESPIWQLEIKKITIKRIV